MVEHKKLKNLLRDMGCNNCVLAKASGMSPSYLSAILNGWQPAGEISKEKLIKGMCSIGLSRKAIEEVTGTTADRKASHST